MKEISTSQRGIDMSDTYEEDEYEEDEYEYEEECVDEYEEEHEEEDECEAEHAAPVAEKSARATDTESATKAGGRRLPRSLLLIAALALLPSVLSVTGMIAPVLAWIHPELSRVTSFDQLSLHWWTPVECRGLELRNTRDWSKNAPPLLTAQRVVTKQPLWKIALNMGQGIDVTVVRPEVTLLDSDQGSNLTDALQDLAPSEDSTQATFPFRVAVQEGRIVVATAKATAVASDPLSVEEYSFETLASGIQCEVSTLDHSTLPDVSLVAALGDDDVGSSVAGADPFITQTTVNPRIAARLDDLAADFQPLQLETPAADSARLRSIEIHFGSAEGDSRRALHFTARGLQLDRLQPLLAQLVPGVQCRGLLSVKGEALMLGERPTDGLAMRAAARAANVEWRMASWPRGESLQMSTASADCAVAVAEDGVIVRALSAECPFAEIHGDGEIRVPADQLLNRILMSGGDGHQQPSAVFEAEAAAAGQVNIRGELSLVALSRMLPQTLHLRDGLELRKGALRFALRTQTAEIEDSAPKALNWQAVVETSPLIAWHQRQEIRWDAPVRLQCSGPLSLSSSGLNSAVVSGDFGELRIAPHEGAADVRGRINVDRLWSHLGQFIDAEPPGIRGAVSLNAWVEQLSAGDMSLRNLSLVSDNLRVESERIRIRLHESLLQMLDGQLALSGNGAAVRSLVRPWTDLNWLASDSDVSLQLDAAPPRRLTVVGEVRPGATASRSLASGIRAQGDSSSTLLLSQAQLALDIDAASQPGEYVIRSGRLRIPGAEARLSGTLTTMDAWMTAQLAVDADYDLEMISRMVLNDPQGNIRLSGRSQSRFEIRGTPAFWDGSGPTDAEPFEVVGDVAWDSAEIHGLQLGPGTAPFLLKSGQIRTEPIRCTLNDGQLNAMINYDLQENQLALAPGSRVENVTVTPELSARWLGYVTPLLADAAGVHGSVSARADQFQYDVDQPQHSRIAGTVDIHGITASPGGSLTVLLQALDSMRSGRRTLVRDMTMPPQQVQVEMRNGMITHDQVLITLSGYHLQTHGGVGLNRQLALILDVPLERSGEQQSGRYVSVPVRGTVERPSIDLQRLVQDVGGQRIQDEINNQLDRGINRLFDKL